MGALGDQLVVLGQGGLLELRDLLLLLLQLDVQLRLILAESLLVGARRLELLGKVLVGDLLLVELGARELEAVLGHLELRLEVLDLPCVLLLEHGKLSLVQALRLLRVRLVALFHDAYLLLVAIAHLGH